MRLSYLRRGSPGQAMVLGSVALLCLTLGVLATLNLGQAVHEKIKLQNTADAAAYSLATMEARTFNYIAFTNRVQITHYHTAMVVQSYVSYAGYSLAIMGTAADMLRGIFMANRDWCSRLPYPANVPFCAGAAMTAFSTAIDAFLSPFKRAYDEIDRLARTFVEAMSLYNRDAMHKRIQLMKAAQLNVHLLTGMQEFVKRNDQQIEWTSQNPINYGLNIILNSYEYWNTFDKGAGLNPSGIGLLFAATDLPKYKFNADDDRVKEAQAIMAEIANATRAHKDVYDRSGLAVASLGFGSVVGQKRGQTRLIGRGDGSGLDPKPEIAAIRTQDHYGNCTGDRIASDDFVQNGIGLGFSIAVFGTIPNVTLIGDGIRADADGGKHYLYNGVQSGTFQGPRGMIVALPPNQGTPRDSFGTESGSNHKWAGKSPNTMAPYFKFKPYAGLGSTKKDREPSGADLKTIDYNQPSTWMYLNKRPKEFQTGPGTPRPWYQKFSITGPTRGNFVRTGGGDNNNLRFQARGSNTVSLDTTIGGERQAFLDFMQGLNVLSRGQVYYHRPDDWREQPNFFNPFWRARLAPIGQILTNLWERLVGNSLVPGPEASLIQQMMQNFLNNALADFFMATVTGIITH
ncbi:MAG: Tad domain-containing protein [Deltaproteobacteria bacterium]|nr:Tad domain-containing protein [Deltaproteobacteria bacterium]